MITTSGDQPTVSVRDPRNATEPGQEFWLSPGAVAVSLQFQDASQNRLEWRLARKKSYFFMSTNAVADGCSRKAGVQSQCEQRERREADMISVSPCPDS